MSPPNYQEMIASLERYWADYGCVLSSRTTELAAGTMNPATFLRSLGLTSGRRPMSSR